MANRKIKRECYLEQLGDAIIEVDMNANQLNKLMSNDEIDSHIIERDITKTKFRLELSLASMCIILRKMNENEFITLDEEKRRDINSIIHSNRFDYIDYRHIYVYSHRGKEEVLLEDLMKYAKTIMKEISD